MLTCHRRLEASAALAFGIGVRRWVDCRDAVLFFGPGPEIDLLAALAAEWPKAVTRSPFDFLAAVWAFDDRVHHSNSEIAQG